MTDNDAPVTPPASSSGKVFRFAQRIVFLLLLLLALIALIPLDYRGAPGFPETLFWISLACCVALALAHLAPLFSRMGRPLKVSAYIAIVPIFILTFSTFGSAVEAYHQTPEGKVEKAKQDAADAVAAKDAGERAEAQRGLAKPEQTRADLEKYEKKLEGCFSMIGHRLEQLETEVRSSLHNPDAFQHDETFAIVTDDAGNNVAMRFRAENGFGALRAATVKARINVNDCSVVSVGEMVVADWARRMD